MLLKKSALVQNAVPLVYYQSVKVRFPSATAETLSSLDCLVSNGMALICQALHPAALFDPEG
jgi:hypothetical protein